MRPTYKAIWYSNRKDFEAGVKKEGHRGWRLLYVERCPPEGNWLQKLATIITNRSRFEFEATYKKEIRGRY